MTPPPRRGPAIRAGLCGRGRTLPPPCPWSRLGNPVGGPRYGTEVESQVSGLRTVGFDGDQPGHLYLIGFDNDAIKAGRTDDLDRRTDEHLRDAARFGIRAVNRWTSERIEASHAEERRLLAMLNRFGRRTEAGREYLHDVSFTVAQYQAEILMPHAGVGAGM